MSIMRVDFPYLMEDRDRHGNVRVYVRRNGRKVRIKEPMGSPGFARAYSDAMEALEHPEGHKGRQRVLGRATGHAGLAGGILFRIEAVHRPGWQVAIDATPCDRGMPTRTAEARRKVNHGRVSNREGFSRSGHDADGPQGR
jgi:hypothetical protein